jgi:hypothetical protein
MTNAPRVNADFKTRAAVEALVANGAYCGYHLAQDPRGPGARSAAVKRTSTAASVAGDASAAAPAAPISSLSPHAGEIQMEVKDLSRCEFCVIEIKTNFMEPTFLALGALRRCLDEKGLGYVFATSQRASVINDLHLRREAVEQSLKVPRAKSDSLLIGRRSCVRRSEAVPPTVSNAGTHPRCASVRGRWRTEWRTRVRVAPRKRL